MNRFANYSFVVALVLLTACSMLPLASKPMPTSWPLQPFTIPPTSRIIQVIDRPNDQIWALFINTQPNGAGLRDSLVRELQAQGYKAAIAPTQDLRRYDMFMISKDGLYYATLASGSDGSYPTPTTFKSQLILEIVGVQAHRMRLGI